MGCLMFFAFAGFLIAMSVFMGTLLTSLVVFAVTMGIYMSMLMGYMFAFVGYMFAFVMILFA